MATRSAIGRLDGASVSARTIYVGGIAVAGGDYTNSPGTDPGGDAVPIDGLDALVTRRHRLDFVLDYPFERPYEGHVIGDAGITLRQIIDAVRAGYRTMYRGAPRRVLHADGSDACRLRAHPLRENEDRRLHPRERSVRCPAPKSKRTSR